MAVPILKMITVGLLPSPLKVLWYRLNGAKIGKRVSIGIFSIIDSDKIEIGDDTKIGPITFITCDSLTLGKRVQLGMMMAIDTGKVFIDNDTKIMEQVVIAGLRTPRSSISIGKRCKIASFSFFNPTEPLILEDDVGVGGATYIFTHGSWQSSLEGFPISFAPVTIKKGVWLSWRTFVMPNVTIGEYATIGAGAVVSRDIPGRSLAVGTPARVIKKDGEYIKSYSEDEKHLMVRNKILTEFCGYLNYKFKKMSFTYEPTEQGCIIQSADDTISWEYSRNFTAPSNKRVLISFEPITTEMMNHIASKKQWWFDIVGQRTFHYRDIYWTETKDFFSRYGVRFEIES